MFNDFEKFSAPLQAPEFSPAELALKSWDITYEKKPDGSLLVPGDIQIWGLGLTELPDLSAVIIGGDFDCSHNELTSLKGAPRTVRGSFKCYRNRLATLEHAPQTVGHGFYCQSNELTSLEHAPQNVGGFFDCSHNPRLASLKGAPQAIGGGFYCQDCRSLKYLEHAPATLQFLIGDFGRFLSWEAVPEHLRVSPETKARQEQERLAKLEQEARSATVLQRGIAVGKTFRFKPQI